MIINTKHIIGFILILASAYVLTSCSQENHSFVSRNYHNLTARDNAYFLARERTKELEREIDTKNQNDYNKILFPLSKIDTTQTKSYKEKTDDIIKKGSLPIMKHKNSHYVDDSYILVGKARVLRGEWKLALETFKFVNSKGENLDERHEALIQLMRLLMLKNDLRSAAAVSDYLKKQKLSKKNTHDFFLTQAQYHRRLDQYPEMLKYMELVTPVITGRREKKARAYFIIGQLHQLLNRDSLAFLHYKKTIKNNPPYELSFYAKLYMAQVASINKSSDRKRIERYFKKLLKDLKNVDYKDKIYYEMGLFEYKQKNIPKAITHLERSLRESKGNNYQKGASYLKLGEIYYDDLKKFETSKYYYDSTVAVWDKNDRRYKEISDRQKILADFVKQLQIIRVEDSLQNMSKMSTAELEKYIDEAVAREEAEIERKAKLAAEKKKKEEEDALNPVINTNVAGNLPPDASNWYFYNPTALNRGLQDFKRKWGNRKLEPNWRRSVKEVDAFADLNNPANNKTNKTGDPKVNDDSLKAAAKPKVDRKKYYKDIPHTPEELAASNEKVQEAMYQLGRIYNLKLEEQENAITTFEDLLKRYPDYENAPQVLYFLHLINKDLKHEKRAEEYKQRLIKEYPNSLYAKLLKNPNYLKESKETNKQAASLYKQAFEMYERAEFNAADSMLTNIVKTFPDNDITDKIKLLKILIVGQTKNALVYKTMLQDFINDKDNEFSKVLPKAKELLATSEEYLNKLSQQGGDVKTTDVRYSTNTSKPHFFVTVYNTKKAKEDIVLKKLNEYNKKYYSSENIVASAQKLTDSSFVIVVKTFEAMYPSKQYFEKMKEPGSVLKPYQQAEYRSFYITEDNYKLFYRDKNIDTYMEFFGKNY